MKICKLQILKIFENKIIFKFELYKIYKLPYKCNFQYVNAIWIILYGMDIVTIYTN